MKRIMVAMTLMGAALVASGVAWAATVNCQVGVFCEGTDQPDELIGTNSVDRVFGKGGSDFLERVMNSIRNGLGMRETEIMKEPTRLCNPHSYAIFAQVHNTL